MGLIGENTLNKHVFLKLLQTWLCKITATANATHLFSLYAQLFKLFSWNRLTKLIHMKAANLIDLNQVLWEPKHYHKSLIMV